MRSLTWTVSTTLALTLLPLACGDDGASDAELCTRACEDVLATGCFVAPISESECEANCGDIRSGPCREKHNALLSCGGDEPSYVCNPDDSLTIAGCESEYDTLTDCLNEP